MRNPYLDRDINLDDWVRHVVSIHFDEKFGAPFWIRRAKELKINPVQEIKTFEDLSVLGEFDMNHLRTSNVLEFVPQKNWGNLGNLNVFETGGTTGSPSRFAAKKYWQDQVAWMDWYLDNVLNFPRNVNWLWIGPTGPHAVGHTTKDLINLRGGMCFYIDLDPRFIKLLHAKDDHDTIKLYMDHIKKQAYDVLETQQIDVLATTPALLEDMAPNLVERDYQFKGLFYGGTHLKPDVYDLLQNHFFPNAVHAAEYGNSLTGKAPIRPYEKGQKDVVYYSLYPYSVIELVDPEDTSRLVGYRETGRVRVNTLTEDFFIPKLLERDQAERFEPISQLGWDGVANVRPYTITGSARVIEGVY